MLSMQLAFRNLIGAGLRTWLNVTVLSFAFVVIVFYNGMLDGWNMQAINDTRDWEIGKGQLWHASYDRYDPFTIQDSHGGISGHIRSMVAAGRVTPILITQASAYPAGRMLNVVIKGIDPDQRILELPTQSLAQTTNELPAIIGKRMASRAHLKKGDQVLIRWRDKNGTFDAREITIVSIFDSNVPTIDNGQFWIPLAKMQQMTGMTNEATLLVSREPLNNEAVEPWIYKDEKYLLKEFGEIMQQKKGSNKIIYGLLLSIALLGIFDSQVLSIFRRQKEIGTYIALGMTRSQVLKVFTVEGSAHSILALGLGALYGIPVLAYLHQRGIPMPKSADDAGIAISESIIPLYSFGMVLSTILLVVISSTIVSYLPARKISRMNPTDALKGKIQ